MINKISLGDVVHLNSNDALQMTVIELCGDGSDESIIKCLYYNGDEFCSVQSPMICFTKIL